MPWEYDNLLPVDEVLYCGKRVKIGCLKYARKQYCKILSKPIDNDVFVIPRQALWFKRRGDRFRFAERGSIILHRAGSRIERQCVSTAGEHTLWFGIHPDLFTEYLKHHKLSTDNMGGPQITDPMLRYRIVLLVKHLKSTGLTETFIESYVMRLFLEICKKRTLNRPEILPNDNARAVRKRHLVDSARAYLDAHLNEKNHLEDIAEFLGISIFHLCRIFKQETGVTVHKYLTQQRLGCAVERLIENSGQNLSELAFELGLSSHSHLNQLFRRELKLSPSDLRSLQLGHPEIDANWSGHRH